MRPVAASGQDRSSRRLCNARIRPAGPRHRSQRARRPGRDDSTKAGILCQARPPGISLQTNAASQCYARLRMPGHEQDHHQLWLPAWLPNVNSRHAAGLLKQWAQVGSNHRPLACKASALPLSYAPVPPSSIPQDPGRQPGTAYLPARPAREPTPGPKRARNPDRTG